MSAFWGFDFARFMEPEAPAGPASPSCEGKKECKRRMKGEIAALESEITALGPDGHEGMVRALNKARMARRASCMLCGRCSFSRRPLTPLADLRR